VTQIEYIFGMVLLMKPFIKRNLPSDLRASYFWLYFGASGREGTNGVGDKPKRKRMDTEEKALMMMDPVEENFVPNAPTIYLLKSQRFGGQI
jgi:hypothetical protein